LLSISGQFIILLVTGGMVGLGSLLSFASADAQVESYYSAKLIVPAHYTMPLFP
jgi:hypothetical protein